MKYYLRDDVVLHFRKDDFWVIIHGNVYNLTPFLQDRLDSWNKNMDYLAAFGGKDLSHFFNYDFTGKMEISARTGKPRPIFSPIIESATSAFCKTPGKIWSQDPFYHIGRITRRERRVRIINTLNGQVKVMKVCDEDTIYDIQVKYSRYNYHAGSYLWRKYSHGGNCFGDLLLHETLDGNGLTDPESDIELPAPSIWLYYTDDLTIA